MKKITVLVLGVLLVTSSLSFAQQATPTAQTSAPLIMVGNKHCPVTGEEVGKMGTPLTFEYKGKVYNICCPGCKNAFKNNPEKYSKIAEDDAKIAK